ncbi:hypothetical protein [Spongorhabdus nitratireducens]
MSDHYYGSTASPAIDFYLPADFEMLEAYKESFQSRTDNDSTTMTLSTSENAWLRTNHNNEVSSVIYFADMKTPRHDIEWRPLAGSVPQCPGISREIKGVEFEACAYAETIDERQRDLWAHGGMYLSETTTCFQEAHFQFIPANYPSRKMNILYRKAASCNGSMSWEEKDALLEEAIKILENIPLTVTA